MRNHGWELPYHPLQTVAVAVFSGISFSFFVFFIPFVGSSVLKFHIYAVFSPVVLAVFFLYVRCAGCDPADSGVHQSKRAVKAKQLKAKDLTLSNTETCYEHPHDESERNSESTKTSRCGGASAWLCLPFACFRNNDSAKPNSGEQLLYCSICEAEISRNSKHCRACDKCVHGFDHHCRWLNNCVGKKNYRTFVSLMIACLLLLVIVWTTGIGVLFRCFSEKTIFEKEITHRLGSSFSRISYIVVVVFLSLLAMLATIPLCQLFFFHLILIHKGITTYDYILAVREQEQGQEQDQGEGDGFNSLTSSPASSNITGISAGFSSVGGTSLHRGVFCTPPRMFVEHQQTVLASSGDLESNPGLVTRRAISSKAVLGIAGAGALAAQPQKKISVGINPWKLARMNGEEASKVAAQAKEMNRASSTVSMYPKGSAQVTETEDSSLESSRNGSGEITVVGNRRFARKKPDLAYLTGKERWLLMKDRRGKNVVSHSRPGILGIPESVVLPLPNGFRCSPSRFSGGLGSYPGSSYPGSSYPGSQMASPDPFQESPDHRVMNIPKPPADATNASGDLISEVLLPKPERDGYEASAGESGDEKNSGRLLICIDRDALDALIVSPSEKVAVWEDGTTDATVGKPRTSTGSRSLGSRGSRSSKGESSTTGGSSGSRAEANILKHVRKEWPELRDQLSVSPPDDSTTDASSPTRNNSPARVMQEDPILEDQSRDKLMPDDTPAVPSTRKLKESLLLMAKKKKTRSRTRTSSPNGIFISTPSYA